MEKKKKLVHKKCKLADVAAAEADSEKEFDVVPCTRKFRLKPEDEISLESIFSALLDNCEPAEQEFYQKPQWNLTTKDLHNENQSYLFQERLIISRLTNSKCQLSEPHKIFMERDLEPVGQYCLNVEESYDGFVVFSHSEMTKGKEKSKCGHEAKGKYTNRFLMICEKRMEYNFVDNARIEKTLEARNIEDEEIVVTRETTINLETQRLRAHIKIKDRSEIFILDGGIMLLMRHLVMNNFKGEYEYYTVNLTGKVLRCVLEVEEERQDVRVFYLHFRNVIHVINTQYFNNKKVQSSETYYNNHGRIILHFWNGYNYVLHSTRHKPKPAEHILPKMELMWKSDNLLLKYFKREMKLNYNNAMNFLVSHPDVSDFLHDYMMALLKYKPDTVLEFTIKFFQNMRNRF